MQSKPKVLIFDLWGTTTNFYTPVYQKVQEFFPHLDADSFVNAWRDHYYRELIDPTDPHANCYTVYKAGLHTLLNTQNIDLPMSAHEELIASWENCLPWPDTIPGLQKLRENFIVITLSNADLTSIINISRSTGVSWDAVFSAHHLAGAFKPDPRTYTAVLQALDISAATALMIACHIWDLAGAAQVGLQTAYIHRPLEHGENYSRKTPFPPPGEFTYAAHSFLELAEILAV